MKKVWLIAMATWIVVSALACWFYPVMINDACARYAPMADAFARGDWYYAFHPRFGLVFTLLAGIVSFLTGLGGVYTVQIVSFLLLSVAAVVMHAFARRVSGSVSVAWWTFALTLLAPDFFRYALDGLRDPGKCLVFALVGYAFATSCGWIFAIAILLYITLVTYGFAAASVLLLVWCICFAHQRQWSMLIWPVAAWVVGTAAVTILTWAYTGHCLPAPHFIPLFGRWL